MDNVVYIVMFIPSVIVIEKFGIKLTMLLSLSLSLLGAWIALMVPVIGLQIVGQLIVDAGFPLIASAVTKMPAHWFPYYERFYALSFAILVGIIGFALGDSSLNIFGIEHPIGFAISLSIVGGAAIALIIFFYQDKPDEPPSMS